MAWMQNMYRKFEAMCLELDYILEQEGLEYVNQLQTTGANVKQFCSEIMREVLSKPAEDTMDGVASDSCQVKNTAVDRMSKEGIVQDHFDMEPCNLRQPLYSFSFEPIKVTKDDLSLEEMVAAEIHEKLMSSFKEIHSEEKQVQLEKLDTPEEKDLSISVFSSTSYDLLESNSLTEVIPIDKPSSKSVNLVYSNESKLLLHFSFPSIDICNGWPTNLCSPLTALVPEHSLHELSHTMIIPSQITLSALETADIVIKERSNYDKIYFSYLLTGQLDNSTEDAANLGLSCTVKLDGSCFVIDCNELSSVSSEAGQLWSSEERTANQVFNQEPARYRNLGPESSHRREGFASSVITTPDDSLSDSEWVIV
ncbi:hypothetical protein NC653_027405 [Populus alba x Populus x berolinensis]|uniref:Uncharacterized protein n=1 Tax=Populus alba x Populus x berolinensis TaxID=444605 RepID=A0AAD6Q549_9ROSI|nr:hypothetical protein NC653_027405 [Populus alba x Populus x berolinensis]